MFIGDIRVMGIYYIPRPMKKFYQQEFVNAQNISRYLYGKQKENDENTPIYFYDLVVCKSKGGKVWTVDFIVMTYMLEKVMGCLSEIELSEQFGNQRPCRVQKHRNEMPYSYFHNKDWLE